MTSPNVDGRHYLLMVLAPIRPGEAEGLTAHLRSFEAVSPFARLPRTHVGRLIVIAERLGAPQLLLTAVFDGDPGSYLDELTTGWANEAPRLWGRCQGCPDSPSPAELRRYLEHHQLDATYFFSAYRDATAEQVLRALDNRERLVAFTVAAQTLEPAARREAFLREFG
ncbi:MAG TPA: hypothetical protein VLI04_20660 [Nocardioidaceae bacterium]|nr:hypothetical protein [Nocardioidaceae bacterium]